ncbi:helix-turn-helix domain-containing protein [Christiangramia fulva]|nr:helix-turn-helix domain-containing protein [Christiangramia fulva]
MMSARVGKDKVFIQRLKQLILENLQNEQFGAEVLASQYGISRSQLHRKLKKSTGKSVTQFIKEIRLHEAFKMLVNDESTVSEIAYKVGFSSPTYFNTCFKDLYGYPPGEAKFRFEIQNDNMKEFPNTGKRSVLGRNKKNIILGASLLIIIISAILISNHSVSSQKPQSNEKFGDKTIALLPLQIEGGDEKQKKLGTEMTRAIIQKLQKINAIDKVSSYNAVMDFNNGKPDLTSTAKQLKVRFVTTGKLSFSENRFKIHLEAWDSDSKNIVWNKDFSGEWKIQEIFSFQADIAQSLATLMNAEIKAEESKDLKEVLTLNQEAYENYMAAETMLYNSPYNDYDKAQELYQRAIDLDPSFLEAYVGLANTWIFGGLIVGMYNEETAWGNAKRLLIKAQAIDPGNRSVEHSLYAGYYFYEWDFQKMEYYFQKYKDNPSTDFIAFIYDYAIKTGRYQAALNCLDRIFSENPTVAGNYGDRAELLMFMGNKKAALERLKTGDALFSYNRYYLSQSAKVYYYLGEYDLARQQLKHMEEIGALNNTLSLWLSSNLTKKGEGKSSEYYLNRLKDLYKAHATGSPAWFIALYYAERNDKEKTYEWLQRSFDRHEVEMTWLIEEPVLAPFRDDQQYKSLLKKMKFPATVVRKMI